jgi:hypothetical protein
MNTTLAAFPNDGLQIGAMALGVGVAIVAIISSTIRRVVTARQIEQSRREIAAYVAEGSMSAEDGQKLLAAGKGAGNRGCC